MSLCDMIISILYCADGSCLCKVVNNNVFPIYNALLDPEWKRQAQKDIKQVCGLDVNTFELHKWFKYYLPNSSHTAHISTVVLKATIPLEQKRRGKLAAGYYWIFLLDMTKHYGTNTVTTPIFLDFYAKLTPLSYESLGKEFGEMGIFVEVQTSGIIKYPHSDAESLIKNSRLMGVQEAFFEDFYSMCQPNVVMSQYHFISFLKKLGLQGNWIPMLFRAADLNNVGFLTFRAVAQVVTVIDPTTDHYGLAALFRKRFLFRMFDKDNDSLLSRAELESLIEFVRLPSDPEMRSCIVMMKMEHQGKKMSFEEFSRNIESVLAKALKQCLRARMSCTALYVDAAHPASADITGDFTTRNRQQIEKRKGFSISSHTFRIVKSGSIINVEDIWGLKEIGSSKTLRQAGITRDLRKVSCEINAPSLIYNDQITNLRYLIYVNKIRSSNRVLRLEEFNWGTTSDLTYGKRLQQICNSTKRIVMEEKRVIEIRTPVYVIGSVHGNLGDLVCFEKNLWPRSPGHSPGAILCLGSYVDRVPYGVEVVTFLFCYKNLFPKKVYLLRGRHEIRKIQQKDCFQKECFRKFGDKLGYDVFESVNDVFDCLPLAAVIDDKILCVHSGIPQPIVCTLAKFINAVPCPLRDPEKNSQLAWELFWNEPAPRKDSKVDDSQIGVDGFVKNSARGTGYTFNMDALHKFLDTNFFTHLIRTGEPVPGGFTVSNKGHVITVFTSSNYGDYKNDAGCLLLDRGKIRVLRLGLSKSPSNQKIN